MFIGTPIEAIDKCRYFAAMNVIRMAGRLITKAAFRWLQWRGYTHIPSRATTKDAPPYLYDEDNLTTSHNHDFVACPEFQNALAASRSSPLASRGYFHGRWNIHVSIWAARHAQALQGDIVQLGVCEGAEATAIVHYVKDSRLFLVDTFTGVPPDVWTPEELKAGADSAQWAYKEMGDLFPYVSERFKPWPNVTVIQGRVPDVLPDVKTDRIGLLMLDMNSASPERAAADYFWDRILPGGIILSDDYGHSREGVGFYAQKIAFDQFAESNGVSVLTLPTGHGLIIKP
jgi:O-methyltransferase